MSNEPGAPEKREYFYRLYGGAKMKARRNPTAGFRLAQEGKCATTKGEQFREGEGKPSTIPLY
jgi:hypothetical protein